VKNQAKASAYRRLYQPMSILQQLLVYDGLGDWRYINTASAETDAVTAADVQRVVREYFSPQSRTVGVFRRKAEPAP
jgi:predicted Zn-dependent peptidase